MQAGVYRERVSPPRGGQSDAKRIICRAGPGERVTVKGSEIVKGWSKVQEEVWKLTLPNTFFGSFSPYRDVIHGDWFDGKGRTHHTGAVYPNGDWLTEAVKLEEVMMPEGAGPDWLVPIIRDSLFNVAWFRPVSGASAVQRQTVTTELLGKTVVSQCAFEHRDGSPLSLNVDYLGKRRDKANPFPGPFETVRAGRLEIKVWPVEAPPNRSR